MNVPVLEIQSKLLSKLTQTAQEIFDLVKGCAGQSVPLDQLERSLVSLVLQNGRVALDGFIQLQGNGDIGEQAQTAEGETLYRSAQPTERVLRTVFGEHRYKAFVYSAGAKRKIQMRPIDARMELPEGRHSFLYEEWSQLFCVEQAFGQACTAFEAVLEQKASVDTFEHINRDMGVQAEEFLHDLPKPPADKEAQLLVMSADGKGVPFVEEDAKKLSAMEDKPERPGNRKMATLNVVYSVDPYVRTPEEVVAALFKDERDGESRTRPCPQFKQVVGKLPVLEGENAGPSSTLAIGWGAEQVLQRRQSDQKLIVLLDGQRSLQDECDGVLRDIAEVPRESYVHILDILHVAQYIWRAAKALYANKGQQEAFARERLLRILKGQAAAVIRGILYMASVAGLSGKPREEIDTVCGYLKSNLDRMNYRKYLSAGYPIATGVIEGACRHVVKDRFERSGMRWTLEGARAMLNLRAVHASSYWDEFHAHRKAKETARLYPYRNEVVTKERSFNIAV